jgi:hypothetical protein
MTDPLLTPQSTARKREGGGHRHHTQRFVGADEQSYRVVTASGLNSELARLNKRQKQLIEVTGIRDSPLIVRAKPVSAPPAPVVAPLTKGASDPLPATVPERVEAVQTATIPPVPTVTLNPTPAVLAALAPAPTMPIIPLRAIHSAKRNTRTSAACWDVLEPIHDELTHKLCGARCKILGCDYSVTFSVYHGTHVFDSHINLHKARGDLVQSCDDNDVESITDEEDQRYHRALTVAIVLNHWPMSTCDSVGLRVFVNELRPGWIPLTRHSLVVKYLMDLRDKYRVDAVGSLRDGCDFSLHFDAWKAGKAGGSTLHRGFVGITFCTIDKDWNRRVAGLSVRRLKGHHTTPAILDLLKEVIEQDYGISIAHLVSTHTDNHNTECAVASGIVSSTGMPVMHLRCFNHTLHLAVCDVFDNVVVARDMRDICHEVVGVFAERRLLSEKLSVLTTYDEVHDGHAVGPTTVVQDVSVRWNSVFNMLLRLWLLRDQITAALDEEIRGMGNGMSDSVEKARRKLASLKRRFEDIKLDLPFLLEILRPCKVASDLMEADSACASALIPIADKLERKMQVGCHEFLSDFIVTSAFLWGSYDCGCGFRLCLCHSGHRKMLSMQHAVTRRR